MELGHFGCGIRTSRSGPTTPTVTCILALGHAPSCDSLRFSRLIRGHVLVFPRHLKALVDEPTEFCELPPVQLPKIQTADLTIEPPRIPTACGESEEDEQERA